jgi:hypothetical protein
MSTTIRDASLTTARRRQLALYGWRNSQAATSVKREQAFSGSPAGGPTAEVPLERFVGAQLVGQTAGSCACSPAVTLAGYSKNSPGDSCC